MRFVYVLAGKVWYHKCMSRISGRVGRRTVLARAISYRVDSDTIVEMRIYL
jgi:hypothetical protein